MADAVATALGQLTLALANAGAAAETAEAQFRRADALIATISAALTSFRIQHRWVGTRLDIYGPEGFVTGVDLRGPKGNDGVIGWTPILSVVADGARRVLRVVDWIGGDGVKPPVGVYLGSSGFVSNISSGVDIDGAAIDTAGFVQTNGSTPFTDVQSGVAPPAGSNAAQLVTSAWVRSVALALAGGTMQGPLTLSGDPTNALHAATKQYVDAVVQGMSPKTSVLVASTGNLTLSGLQTIDGVSVTVGARVLAKDMTNPALNGIYLAGTGAWQRAPDMNTWAEVPSAFVLVEQGALNADTGWVCTADQGGALGTTPAPWIRFGTLAGLAPLASPPLTGTPTAPTAAAGTNTTQIASTAFVVAEIITRALVKASTGQAQSGTDDAAYMTPLKTAQAIAQLAGTAGAITGVRTISGPDTVQALDKGKILIFSGGGSFQENLPAAASVGANFYAYVVKGDGGGVVTLKPSGAETINGRGSIAVYQESFMIQCDGASWRTVGRTKGWVVIGAFALGSAVASVDFTAGFGDTELRDMLISANGVQFPSPDTLIARVSKNGVYQTDFYNASGSAFTLTGASSTSILAGQALLKSFAAAGPPFQVVEHYASPGNGAAALNIGSQSAAAAIDGFRLQGSASNLTGGLFTQMGFRP